ncbi:MAG: exodeoxyribonuclease V subunit alpha [Nitriliruptor sp.]|nr:MAG: exodeoxyribonuclease V subunit alpha [Nitriliruptor sp.]
MTAGRIEAGAGARSLTAADVPVPVAPPVLPALAPFVAGGVLTAAEGRLAERLGRIGGEDQPQVLLAAALALRGPRYGHVCVELDRIAAHVAVEPQPRGRQGTDAGPQEVASLPWPATEEWREVLSASPLVRSVSGAATPLVLDGTRLYLDRYWQYEQRLAAALEARAVAWEDGPAAPAASVVAWLDELFGPARDLDRQRLAAAVALTRRLTVIAGGPGTGKTYTVARVLALLHRAALATSTDRPLRVVLVAPTGKAAARLQESLREALGALTLPAPVRAAMERTPASTIHRLLGVTRASSTRFRHDARHPVPYDVVIVDEASMVSLPLMAKLVDAVDDRSRLILLGDRDQLASVEAGAVFGDICGPAGSRPTLRFSPGAASALAAVVGGHLAGEHEVADRPGIWDAIVRLDRFRRFSSGSDLGAVAAAIQASGTEVDRAVELLRVPSPAGPETVPGAAARLLDPDEDPAAARTVTDFVVDRYAEVARLAVAGAPAGEVLAQLASLRVLCARRRGPDGVEDWNRRIERRLTEGVPGFDPSRRFYVGRPILITRNDDAVRLYNGDVGVIVEDADQPGQLVAAFWTPEAGVRTISPARLPACETTFAMTIHKSQGSQFAEVVIVLTPEPSPVLTRELVYTAITRASQRATVLGRAEILRTALSRPVQRASGLQHRLWRGAEPASPGG